MENSTNITDSILANIRRWHDGIDCPFGNIGNEPTFSMPLTTEDLVIALDRQHHEDFEEHLQEGERQRQEIERLHVELNALKNHDTLS